jgi:hypothetical protein
VLRRDDQNELIQHSSCQAFLARPESMPADDPKIELTFSDSSLDALRIRDVELYIHAGVFGPKRRNESRQHVEPRSRAGADHERPVGQAIQVGERLTPPLNRREGTLGKLREDTARLGHGDNPAASPTQESRMESDTILAMWCSRSSIRRDTHRTASRSWSRTRPGHRNPGLF